MIADVDGYFAYDSDYVRPNPVFVEVGAYTDHAVKPLKAAYPASRILVVEASPTCLKSLKSAVAPYGEWKFWRKRCLPTMVLSIFTSLLRVGKDLACSDGAMRV